MRSNFWFFPLLMAAAVRAEDPQIAYQQVAQKYAEALLRYGRDHYGARETPLFAHMLDLRTLEIPKQRTAAEWKAEMANWKEDRNYLLWGKDRSSVLWAQDSNLLWDTENIRLFYALSRQTGDAKFASAANDYIRYFLKHCVSPTTGLFAWGEHMAYNIQDDEIHGQRHELQHSDPLWEELWQIDPDAVRSEIEGVYRYHITDKSIMAYDRHANFWNGLPERDQATILGYLATYIEAFSFLSQKTQDAKYEEWAHKLTLAFQSKSNAAGLYPDNWTDRQAREMPYSFIPRPTIAVGLYEVYERTGNPRWLDDGNRYLDACDVVFRGEKLEKNDRLSGEPSLVEAALRAYRFTGRETYLRMASRVGEDILQREQPHAQMASTLADRLNVLRRLYQVTGDAHWLEGARKFADYAVAKFVHPSGLIRGTAVVDRPDYYDAIQGPGALALALYELGGAKIPAVPFKPELKQNSLPPVIADLRFPKLAGNLERVAVSARISDPSGVKHASLYYTYGNQIEAADSSPDIDGGVYTFHIHPPGINFQGEVLFAVEAVGTTRGMTAWNRLILASYEREVPSNGSLRFTQLGVTVEGTGQSGGARAGNTLPEGTRAPAAGWVSTGNYVCFDQADLHARRIAMTFAPEDTWRLIGSTLTLAFWNGSEWQRDSSTISSKNISADYHAAKCWTLLGEDRVLWRAPGRDGGIALADLEHDGRFEVATVAWQPGQLLSSTGMVLKDFPVDPPYHPLNNPSPPSVATLHQGDPPLLLLGAPAGYVYAYDKNAKLHWQVETGGELIGGVAVGRLMAGGDQSVVAAWDGGVQAIDASGKTMWRTGVAKPSGSVPVLVDLDGDGQLDIVINAGAEIVALKGSTGAKLWSFTLPGAHFATPTAGSFVRNGKPRVVIGDQNGVVYALDESGKLLWSQNRIYGPREVPEQIDQYAPISELGLADLEQSGERQVIVTTKSGDTVALGARGERLWHFSSYERRVGTSLNRGGHLAFADLDGDGKLEVIVAQQDSYVYVLDAEGRSKWIYRGYFWYHNAPAVADLQHTGELDIVFTAPEEGGTYALRSGTRGTPGRAPWPMDRGGLQRTNCFPW